MGFLQFQAFGGLFALLFLSIYWWTRSKKSNKVEAPELAGGWPVIGHLHLLRGRGHLHQFLAGMSLKYGPTFTLRFGMNRTLVVSSWEVAKECFTTNDKVLATRPNSAGGKYLGYDNALFTFSPFGPYWREMRKIATQELLSNLQLEKLKHVRALETDTCIKNLYKLCVGENGIQVQPILVDMKQWFADLTLNVVVMMIRGKRYNISSTVVGENNEMRQFQTSLSRLIILLRGSLILDAFPFLQWFAFRRLKAAMKSTATELDTVLGSWVKDHRLNRLAADAESRQDFIDVMISTLEGTEFSHYDHDTIIKATSLAMIIGGADTTTNTLTWALALLLNNRDVLRKVQSELDMHVGKERHVEESDIQHLIYLQAVMKETLRLYPALPLSIFHVATEDCIIGGYNIQAGTQVIVNLRKLQRDSRVWSNPSRFEPERFLTRHADVDLRGQDFELIPFGSGRRSCPGISFAFQIMHLTLARLLHGFNLATPGDSSVDMSENSGATLAKATPLEVLVTPRLSSKLYE